MNHATPEEPTQNETAAEERDDAALKTPDVYARLRERYSGNGWLLLTEVQNATGMKMKRAADAVALQTWPSVGIEFVGFEVKVSRGDWLREVANPAKARAVARYMDRWWIVAGASGIAKQDELPASWGLMVATPTGLRVVKAAPKLDAEPLSRDFLAALLARAVNGGAEAATREEVRAARRAGHVEGYAEAQRKLAGHYKSEETAAAVKFADLLGAVRAFEEASGVHIEKWNAGRVGAAVRHVLAGGLDVGTLKQQRARLAKLIGDLDGTLADLEQATSQGAGGGRDG